MVWIVQRSCESNRPSAQDDDIFSVHDWIQKEILITFPLTPCLTLSKLVFNKRNQVLASHRQLNSSNKVPELRTVPLGEKYNYIFVKFWLLKRKISRCGRSQILTAPILHRTKKSSPSFALRGSLLLRYLRDSFISFNSIDSSYLRKSFSEIETQLFSTASSRGLRSY